MDLGHRVDRHRLRKLIASAILTFCLSFLFAQQKRAVSPQIIGYVFSRDRVLQPNEIAAQKLTRIQYAFLYTKDGRVAEASPTDAANLAVMVSLKRINPALEVVVSIGGGSHSDGFSDIAATSQSRGLFVESCVKVVEQYHLDGMDIDWEYPATPRPGGHFRAEDKQNYTLLLRDLRIAFDLAAKALGRHLVTSTATDGKPFFLRNTEMAEVARYVDTIALMGYDQYGHNDATTGNHAALFTDPADPKHFSDEQAVEAYIAAGVPAEKIVLGVPFYGVGWSGVPAKDHGLFQPVVAGKTFDVLYTDIAKKDLAAGSGFIRYWDNASQVPYLYNAETQTFISYEDPESLRYKADFVQARHLGGMMFWAYNGDPENVLLDAIDAGLQFTPRIVKRTPR